MGKLLVIGSRLLVVSWVVIARDPELVEGDEAIQEGIVTPAKRVRDDKG